MRAKFDVTAADLAESSYCVSKSESVASLVVLKSVLENA
jgi:hypothetical protein